MARGRERRSGESSGWSHELARALAARAALGMRGWAGQRGKGGGQHGGVLRTSRHLDWRKGEARGGGERHVNGREHADVLQSAQMAGTRGFFSRRHAPTCVWQLQGGVNNVAMALDALEIHWRGEGVEMLLPRVEKWSSSPLHHCFLGQKSVEVLEGD